MLSVNFYLFVYILFQSILMNHSLDPKNLKSEFIQIIGVDPNSCNLVSSWLQSIVFFVFVTDIFISHSWQFHVFKSRYIFHVLLTNNGCWWLSISSKEDLIFYLQNTEPTGHWKWQILWFTTLESYSSWPFHHSKNSTYVTSLFLTLMFQNSNQSKPYLLNMLSFFFEKHSNLWFPLKNIWYMLFLQ